jgi:hypothetical protein
MMHKRVSLFIGLALALVLTGTALAQEPGYPEHSDPYWEVWYWNNTTLSGNPVVTGTDAQIDWHWGYGSPRSGVGVDRFSARWTRYVDVPQGTYRFTATADDGVRVSVDGRRIIDEWYDHPARTFSADVSLSAGHHRIEVEYYENTGMAVARLTFEPVPSTFHNWRGEYFGTRWLSGEPLLVRDDANIDFNWGNGSPAAVLPSDGFSVRWTRTVNFQPGLYRFTATTDDGVRLWVNGHLLIDNWRDQPFWSKSGTIHVAGDVPIKMEYYENGGIAAARLTWVPADGQVPTPEPPTGGVIVDDTDAGFVVGGASSGWRTANEGYGGRLTWTRNNDRERYNYNWARWYPTLTPGRYEVLVYIPERYSTTSSARYWVAHADGYAPRSVDQSRNGSRWVSLGTYRFDGGNDEYVSLSDVTFEPRLSRLIAFDAVQWVPR